MSLNSTESVLIGPPYGPVINGSMVIVFYEYLPTEIGGYLFMALFAITTIANIILLFFRPRAWYCIPLVLGGIAETFGYYGRARSHTSPADVGPWILQNLLILAAAPLIAATMYTTLRRLSNAITTTPPSYLRWTTPLFITMDFGCLASQMAGTIMPASGNPTAIAISQKVILGGLVAQLIALILFFWLTMGIHQKMKGEEGSMIASGSGKETGWRKQFRALEIMTVLLAVRSLVRLAEYAQGFSGFVASHEVFIYLFDAIPMWFITLLFVALHPQRFVRSMMKGRKQDEVTLVETGAS